MTVEERLSKLHITTLQSRLGAKQDHIRRKVIDNNSRLVSTPTDCIRCRARKTFEGDDISWIVERADVVNIVFPKLEDVPIRKIRKDKDNPGHYVMTSLVGAFEDGTQQKYVCQMLHWQDIDINDLLFRVLLDDTGDYPTVLILRVSELLGTFGEHEHIKLSFNVTIPTDDIPQEIVDTVCQMIDRRRTIGW